MLLQRTSMTLPTYLGGPIYPMNKLWYLSQISIFEEMSREEIREIDQLDTILHFN
jgi:hypothetical protein